MKKLKNKKSSNSINKLPQKPGVYLFKNQNKKIIYIGKALALKNRVKSYFCQKNLDFKTKLMVKQITSLDYQVVLSEFEALLLEANLIKQYQPKYNLALKDNKRYLYLAISKAPYRLFPTRRPELEKNLFDWYGPFPSAGAVQQVLRLLRRIFPFCSCRQPARRQCLYFHLKLCPGYQNLNSFEYQQNIKQIRQFLNGKTRFLLRQLKIKMIKAAKELEFEEAQKYKNQFINLEMITQGWRPLPADELRLSKALLKLRKILVKYQGLSLTTLTKIEGYDVANLSDEIIVGAAVTFIDGQPEKGLYRKFKINFHCQDDPGAIKQIISRRLNHPEWLYPQLILVDGGKGQTGAAFAALKEKNLIEQIAVLGLAKKEEKIIIPRIEKNQIISWQILKYSSNSPLRQLLQQIRDESHRFAQKYYHHLQAQKIVT